ncbi:MAG TPA: DUF5916 domain-containing protein, partial [Gemmatimonadales bacterium]
TRSSCATCGGSAVRAPAAPALDGRLDDAVWAAAPVIDDFLEYEPNEGAETRFRTEARVAYDDRNLYVHVRMFDPAPDSMVSLLARRDERAPSEQLKIVIDSYHDRRTAYQFAVNPAGVKRDFYVYNDNVEDPSWDAVWDVATVMDSTGWAAEFRIPFSQMRYANRETHTFGLMIVRDVARTGQRISWPLYRRNAQGYVSQSGTVTGITGIAAPRRIEIAPYIVSQNVTRSSPYGFAHPQEATAGVDLKLGLGPNLTLDATVNPDFGQVEADPATLNLTAFEQFFDERRPFFLEGTGIFDYRVQCDDIDTGCTGLFYSRRIGRAPQLLGRFGDDASPTSTTILGAGKLTGRVGGGLSIGLLAAATSEEEGTEGRMIEPGTSYLVARARQELNGGRSDVGAMVTMVDRRLDDVASPYLRSDAYSGGVDLRHRFGAGAEYELAASLTGSVVRGSAEAIARTQMDGVHNYQRPDDGIAFDPTRTSIAGDAQRISVSKFGGGMTKFQTVYQRYSPGFEINDLGFLARADEQLFRNWFQLSFTKPNRFQRRAFHNLNHWSEWSAAGLHTGTGVNYNGHVELANYYWVHAGGNLNGFIPGYDDRASRGGPALRTTRGGNVWFGVEGDGRKSIVPTVFAGTGRTDAGHGRDWYVEPSVRFRLASRFSGSLGLSWSEVVNDNQWTGNFGDPLSDTTHHTFARLDQTTVSMTARVNYIFTPALSLQLYAEPFVSTGEYTNWRELTDDPRAARYEDRYQPYDAGSPPQGFRSLQFRSNTVLRWEYRPGSTLFLVWSQGRSSFDASRAYDFDRGREPEELFGLHPDNTLLVKVSYWFNP